MGLKVHPMLQVGDVEASSEWYQRVVGLVSGHGGAEYEMLFAATPFQSDLVLQLHRWDAHEHGFLGSPSLAVGNGCSLWFELPDRQSFDAVATAAVEGGTTVLAGPAWNPLAHHHEITLRDPDGYIVVLNSPMSAEP